MIFLLFVVAIVVVGKSYPWVSPCTKQANSLLPFCNSSLSLENRTQDLVERIPLNDMATLLIDTTDGSPALHINPYCWWNEALHGLGLSPGVEFSNNTPIATSFPQVIGTACSFNRELFQQIGQAIATEARAFFNQNHAGLTLWAPNVNIYRDPRWGRGQETPGEDPFLTSEYAISFVRGLQEDKTTSSFLKTSACCKHFAGYSQEVPRHRFNAMIDRRDLVDTYFPAFQACVMKANVSSIMCSYNAVNGFPSCANHEFMTNLLRKQWHFDGYIVSDCHAIDDVQNEHHYTQNPAYTCSSTLNAGVDVNCGTFYKQYMNEAIEKKVVNTTAVRRALFHQIRVQMRLGMFEQHPPFSDIDVSSINSAKHQLLALEAARQSLVLLKNENNLLPLDKKAFTTEGGQHLALIGPNANATSLLLSNYEGVPPFLISPLQGLATYAEHLHYSQGCTVESNNTDGFSEARDAVGRSNATILIMGLDMKQEQEFIDRNDTELPGVQSQLIDTMADAANHSIVLIIMSGGSVNLQNMKNNPKIGAILYVGYPGQAGGIAIAQTIFGDNNPSGRLSHTFYNSDFVKQVSMYDYSMRPNEATGNTGRTYRFHTQPVVYPFGHGLSYTSFDYEWTEQQSILNYIELVSSFDQTASILSLQVRVTNTGGLSGEDTVLCFLIPPSAGRDGTPIQSLSNFDRVSLRAGEVKAMTFNFTPQHFSISNSVGELRIVPGLWQARIGLKMHTIHIQIQVEKTISVI